MIFQLAGTLVFHIRQFDYFKLNFTLPHCVHCQTSWTSAWTKGASRGRTRTRARLGANRWEVLPRRGQRVDVGRPGGTRDTGWGYPWWDSRGDVKKRWVEEGGLTGFEMGAAVLSCTAFIGLVLPSHPGAVSVHILRVPLPSVTSHAHLHSDSANRLIFLEQWCQLFIPPFPSLSGCDWFSLSLSLSLMVSLSLQLFLFTVMRWHWLGVLLMPPYSFPRKCPRLDLCVCQRVIVCVFVWGVAARALACCALSARSFRIVCRMDVSLNGNWWVCMGQH